MAVIECLIVAILLATTILVSIRRVQTYWKDWGIFQVA